MYTSFSIKIKNYKCFQTNAGGFDRIFPLNIIIGKNNSGKSTLIDVIENLVNHSTKLKEIEGQLILGQVITDEFLRELAEEYIKNKSISREIAMANISKHFKEFLGMELQYQVDSIRDFKMISTDINPSKYSDTIKHILTLPLSQKVFKRLNAERDIVPEYAEQGSKLVIKANGQGTTSLLKQIVFHSGFNTNIVKIELLRELNKVLNPDIVVADIHPQEISDLDTNGPKHYEIYLRMASSEDYIPISKMGSGIKTVILVLINLIVLPKIEHKSKDSLIFGLEELENNLHPSLQRRLLLYIINYAKENSSTFFITTHSSVVIDLFTGNSNCQIIHVGQSENHAVTNSIQTNGDGKNVLNDLGYKASDLLLSNGILWVEGPSDVVYLELFIELFKRQNNEDLSRLNYSIQSLSTAIWKHAGFSDFNWVKVKKGLQNQLVSLTKLNHNHLIILDRDNNYADLPPSRWKDFPDTIGQIKAKLIHESIADTMNYPDSLKDNYGHTVDGGLLFWVNEGTCESYLKEFLINKGKCFAKYFSPHSSGHFMEKKRSGVGASKSKVELAIEISSFSLDSGLTLSDFAMIGSDLANKLASLFETIKKWN